MSDKRKRDQLSGAWKERFEILDKVDGELFARSKELSARERTKVGFRIFAFLFSALYYLAKGMWEKGLLILAAFSVLSIALGAIGVPDPLIAIAGGVVCSAYATVDYYKLVEKNERVWPFASNLIPRNLQTIPFLSAIAAVALALNLGVTTGLIGTGGLPSCGDDEATELVRQIFNEHSSYTASRIELIRLRQQNEQTGALICDAQLIDNDGDKWQLAYTISKSETEPLGFIVQAEWSL